MASGFAQPHAGYIEQVSGSVKDYCGIFWCCDGSAEFEIDGKSVRLFSGDAVCYSSGAGHRITAAASGFTYYWAVWQGVLAKETLAAYAICSGEKIHVQGSLKEKFNALFDTLRSDTVESSYDGGVILTDMLAAVSGSIETNKNDEKIGKSQVPLVAMFKDLVLSEFHDPALNLDTISSRLGVHRSTVDRAVKKYIGMAPGEYLQDVRLKVALGRLKSSARPVNKICRECGFSSASYFSRVVREKTGFSPKEYREN